MNDFTAQPVLSEIARHHHFRKDLIPPDNRVANLEVAVLSTLTRSEIPDEGRDSSLAFELKHHAGVTQCGRILAEKRGLDLDVASSGALLHDIAVIVTGRYEAHAQRGERFARELLQEVGGFSVGEIEKIIEIVINHSDKHLISPDIYVEFGKDADILDCFLYPRAVDEYFLYKTLPVAKHYLARAKSVWRELGMSPRPEFDLLQDLTPQTWMTPLGRITPNALRAQLMMAASVPSLAAFAVRSAGEHFILHGSPRFASTYQEMYLDSDLAVDDYEDGRWHIVWPALKTHQAVDRGSLLEPFITGDEQ